MDAQGRASAPVRAGADGARPRPTQRQFWFRRVMVLGVPLTLVAAIAGCLGRSGPAPPRIVRSGASSSGWLIYMSSPVRSGPAQLVCGTDKVSFAAPTQVVVSESATAWAEV